MRASFAKEHERPTKASVRLECAAPLSTSRSQSSRHGGNEPAIGAACIVTYFSAKRKGAFRGFALERAFGEQKGVECEVQGLEIRELIGLLLREPGTSALPTWPWGVGLLA